MYGIRTREWERGGREGKTENKNICARTPELPRIYTHTMHFRRRSPGPCNGASPVNPRRSGFCARHYHNRVRTCAQVFCIHYTGRARERPARLVVLFDSDFSLLRSRNRVVPRSHVDARRVMRSPRPIDRAHGPPDHLWGDGPLSSPINFDSQLLIEVFGNDYFNV